MPNPETTAVISIEDAGKILGLGRSAAYAAAQRGEIPVLALGRRRVVPVARLRALVGIDDGPRAA